MCYLLIFVNVHRDWDAMRLYEHKIILKTISKYT